MSQNKKVPFRGKQILLFGLVALVITAGYYRWTMETQQLNSVPVTGETLPVNGENQENADGGEQKEEAKEGSAGETQAPNTNVGLAQLRQERDSV